MIKQVFGTLAALALVSTSATAALACGNQTSAAPSSAQTGAVEQPTVIGEEEHTSEVAGIRIVPSVIAKEVTLTPSKWILKDPESRMANADAKVYTNAQGEITGITVNAVGLPNPERINPRFTDYVVWLVDTDTNQMKNIGNLESRNGGKAVFGYTPDMPLQGFDRIIVTPEMSFATSWPSGWEQLTADIPMTASLPSMEPTAP
jgi:hypothetical protein